MKKIVFVLYRQWAYDIAKAIIIFQKENPNFSVEAVITTPEHEFEIKNSNNFPKVYIVDGKNNSEIDNILSNHGIEVVCYYGWSWIVKEPILSKYVCLCLHPSPLPKYRGGSPIQNQIIDGQTISAVSIFKMSEGLDEGDIYKQVPMSLEGTLNDILARIVDVGITITKNFINDFINNKVIFIPQKNLEQNPPYKRRTKEESELSIEKIATLSYLTFNNIVRALADPYPNTNIIFPDGKLLLQEVFECKTIPDNAHILISGELGLSTTKDLPLYLHVSSNYAQITKYRIEPIEIK